MDGNELTAKEVDDELDEICVRMVRLMDDYCSTIGRLDRCLRDGCVHLAKSRYVMGNRAVSDLQLPVSGQYRARTTVSRDDNGVRLVRGKDGDDSIRRFGVLVPGSLRAAQHSFCGCLESTAEAATITNEISKVQRAYTTLKSVRSQIGKTRKWSNVCLKFRM